MIGIQVHAVHVEIAQLRRRPRHGGGDHHVVGGAGLRDRPAGEAQRLDRAQHRHARDAAAQFHPLPVDRAEIFRRQAAAQQPLQHGEAGGRLRRRLHRELAGHHLVVAGQGHLLDRMAHLGQHLQGVAQGGGDGRVDRDPVHALLGIADPQLRRRDHHVLRQRRLEGRHLVGVAGHAAGHQVQIGGGVAHAAADAALHGGAGPDVGIVRRIGAAAAGDLQSHQAVIAGRDADRAAAVAGMGERQHPGGDRGRRAAAGAAGDPLQVPGIAGWPVHRRLGGDAVAEFRHVGLADQDHAAGLGAAHHLAVMRGDGLRQEGQGVGGDRALRHQQQVLHQPGHARQRPFRQRLAGAGPRHLEMLDRQRVDGVLHRFQPFDHLVDQFQGRHLAGAHQFRQVERVVAVELGH